MVFRGKIIGLYHGIDPSSGLLQQVSDHKAQNKGHACVAGKGWAGGYGFLVTPVYRVERIFVLV